MRNPSEVQIRFKQARATAPWRHGQGKSGTAAPAPSGQPANSQRLAATEEGQQERKVNIGANQAARVGAKRPAHASSGLLARN